LAQLGCVARLSNATKSLRHLNPQPRHLGKDSFLYPTRYIHANLANRDRSDADTSSVQMADEPGTQQIGNVHTEPGGQSFVGTAGRDIIFSGTIDPKGKSHIAAPPQTRADLMMPYSDPGQSVRRLPPRTIPHRPRSRPRNSDNCQRYTSLGHLRMDMRRSQLPEMAGGRHTTLVDLWRSWQGKDHAFCFPG
jgi:hypothetical protein